MKGFGLLLALASVALLLICGPPAVQAGEKDHIDLQSTASIVQNVAGTTDFAETPGISPAVAKVVHDPGSCSGLFASVLFNQKNCRTERKTRCNESGVKRLLCFRPRC